MSEKTTRRDVLTQVAGLCSAIAVLGVTQSTFAQESRKRSDEKPTDLPLADPAKGQAAQLQYHANVADVKDPAVRKQQEDMKKEKFENQMCKNCSQYVGVGKKGSDDVGSCKVMTSPKVLVKSTGWCLSWNKKA